MRIFISYRRDDAGGYAGRLEESLERRLGRGTVFRDVGDIAPGDDFAQTIRQRLAAADGVLVLMGPRWAGESADGTRRIDDPGDFVRLEVQEALASPARVVPVLLRGTAMPSDAQLPQGLKPLAGRQALPLDDLNWDAGVARLVAVLGAPPRRDRRVWVAAGVAIGSAAAMGLLILGRPFGERQASDATAALLGTWAAPVRYEWGDAYSERFEFQRHAGELTGTATFLHHPRAIENLRFADGFLHFETRSMQSMGGEDREQVRSYAAELRTDGPEPVLAFRMTTRGGFGSPKPITFEALRMLAPAAGASAPG